MDDNNEPVGIRNRHGNGARALAQALGNHGVSVREVNADQAATVDDDTTLVVIFPSRMRDSVAKAIETRANVVYRRARRTIRFVLPLSGWTARATRLGEPACRHGRVPIRDRNSCGLTDILCLHDHGQCSRLGAVLPNDERRLRVRGKDRGWPFPVRSSPIPFACVTAQSPTKETPPSPSTRSGAPRGRMVFANRKRYPRPR